MTANVGHKLSFFDDFRALSNKQILIIAAAIVVSLMLETLQIGTALGSEIIGFFLIALILYMVPHFFKVFSVKIKVVIGVVFVVLAMLIGVFAYSNVAQDYAGSINDDPDHPMKITGVSYDQTSGILSMNVNDVNEPFSVKVEYYPVLYVSFGKVVGDESKKTSADVSDNGNGSYSCTLSLPEGGFYLVSIFVVDLNDEPIAGKTFTVDTGISQSDVFDLCLFGSGWAVIYVSAVYFIIVIFSHLIRRSAEKTREKMVEDGRLYPKGYGRCEKCGTLALPGEVTCRKCGTYIEVPDELKAKKKDFFTCSDCGAEVPMDAKTCPRCGASFEEEETEIVHKDGTVEVTEEYPVCPKCGSQIPHDAHECPKCGTKVGKN